MNAVGDALRAVGTATMDVVRGSTSARKRELPGLSETEAEVLQGELQEQPRERRPSLPVIPTVLLTAGLAAVSWINSAGKGRADMTQTREQLEEASELGERPRSIAIITTAALPWLTGTSVNPAIRALELSKRGHKVTLVVPWLIVEDQAALFGGNETFRSTSEQAEHIHSWMRELGSEQELGHFQMPDICFYPGGYARDVGSVLPLCDFVHALGAGFRRDVALLEEPEHLTWYYYGDVLTHSFPFVVGIIHTNYLAYARGWQFPFGLLKSVLLHFYNGWVTRAHTHRIIKLSSGMQRFPRQVTANVHGVRERFLRIGESARPDDMQRGAYFVGKLVWPKGYNRLVPLLRTYYRETGEALAMEWFGGGEDFEAIRDTVNRDVALRNVIVKGKPVKHEKLAHFKVLINASTSEGLATVTLEALSMGKMVVIADHPCNRFFRRFKNALIYSDELQFVQQVRHALGPTTPAPLDDEEKYELSWQAGTDRLVAACRSENMRGPVDRFMANALMRAMSFSGSKIFREPKYRSIIDEDRRKRQRQSTSQTDYVLVNS